MPGLFQIWPGPSSNSASWTRHVILSWLSIAISMAWRGGTQLSPCRLEPADDGARVRALQQHGLGRSTLKL